MKATDKQLSYLRNLAQRILSAKGTPGVEERTFANATHCINNCNTFSKEKVSCLIDDFKFLVRSVNFMRTICNLRQV